MPIKQTAVIHPTDDDKILRSGAIVISRQGLDIQTMLLELEDLEAELFCGEDEVVGNVYTHRRDSMMLMIMALRTRIGTEFRGHDGVGMDTQRLRVLHQLKKDISELDVEYRYLEAAYHELLGSQNKKRHPLNSTDKEWYQSDLTTVRAEIEETKSLINPNTRTRGIDQKCDFAAVMKAHNIEPPQVLGEWREPTDEEQTKVNSWRTRDAQFDQDIHAIGDIVDRLGVLAMEAGAKAQMINQQAIASVNAADELNEDMKEMNAKAREVLIKNNNGSFICCRIWVILLVFGLSGWLVSQVLGYIFP